MLVGTLFYAYENEMGWAKGFYMAVNVGYSIGWGFPVEINEGSRFFSTVYVLVGASAVAAALGFFGQTMIVSSKEWFNEALNQAEKRRANRTKLERFSAWIVRHDTAVKTIGLWVIWISAMILFSCLHVKWSFIDGLYFAVSSLSTGGLYAIPSDSPDWYFGIGELDLTVLVYSSSHF
jgi:Trk-type K+ transport system membrane component